MRWPNTSWKNTPEARPSRIAGPTYGSASGASWSASRSVVTVAIILSISASSGRSAGVRPNRCSRRDRLMPSSALTPTETDICAFVHDSWSWVPSLLTNHAVLSWNTTPHVPRVAAPLSAFAEQRFRRSTHCALSNSSFARRLDVDLGRLRARSPASGRALRQRRLVLLDVAERGDRLAVAAVGLEPQRVRDRLLVLAERHDAAPGERRVEAVVVVGRARACCRAAACRRGPRRRGCAAVVVAVGDQRAALGLEVDDALLDELVREVVRGVLLALRSAPSRARSRPS